MSFRVTSEWRSPRLPFGRRSEEARQRAGVWVSVGQSQPGSEEGAPRPHGDEALSLPGGAPSPCPRWLTKAQRQRRRLATHRSSPPGQAAPPRGPGASAGPKVTSCWRDAGITMLQDLRLSRPEGLGAATLHAQPVHEDCGDNA